MSKDRVKAINLLDIVDGLIVSLLNTDDKPRLGDNVVEFPPTDEPLLNAEDAAESILFEAVKVTKKGIYLYKEKKVNELGKVELKGEIVLYRGGTKILPYDAIVDYIKRRTRIALRNVGKEIYIHTVLEETLELPLSESEESEKSFEKATYMYVRDFYFRESQRGKEVQLKLGYAQDKLEKIDAKMYIVEDQLQTEDDQVALQLFCNNLQSGLLDNSTKILHKETESGEEDKVTQLQELSTEGAKAITMSKLGVRVSKSTMSTRMSSKTAKPNRSVRYSVQQLEISENIISRFRVLRGLKKGIILVNNTTVEDIVAVLYPFNRNFKDKTLNDLNSHDIMYLDGLNGAAPSYCNPHIQMEAMDVIDATDSSVDYNSEFLKEIGKAVKIGYSVYVINGLDYLSDELIKASDDSVVIVIDKFSNLGDVKLKLDNFNEENRVQLINKMTYLLNIQKGALLSVNKTVKNLIMQEPINLSKYPITNLVTYNNKQVYYKKFFYKYLKDENTLRLEVQPDHVILTRSNEDKPRICKCEIPLAACIQFLSDIAEYDIYSEICKNGRCVIDYQLANTEFKILASLNKTDICVIFKKIDLTISPTANYIAHIPAEPNKVSLIFNNPTLSSTKHNEFIASLISELAKNKEKVLIIDNDLSIGRTTFEGDLNISLMQDIDPNNLAEIASVYKPAYIVAHKVTNLSIFNKLLELAPTTKHIYITTKMTRTIDFSLLFVTAENKHLVNYYLQDWLTYDTDKELWVNSEPPIQIYNKE